uniref:ApaLI-like restriction endonuclease n=1 Tax=Candidatus Kentrum sp. FW TaxID=2126338 RepID=A0A450SDC4_9GAMM|nr:MAG: ApaLI-like restriction endonuclease [Candidatus Kentron sp. FW]
MSIKDDIHAMASNYASQLRERIDVRVREMEEDDVSYYLVYRVLGITTREGRLIDLYQNKGRFLYGASVGSRHCAGT